MRTGLRFFPLTMLILLLMGGCAGSDKAGREREKSEEPASRPVPKRQAGLPLLAAADDVRTIQLYLTGDERRLPIVALESSQTLTLAFDLLETRGRPLSVYFYHADREWRRDLSPSEYLASFQRDDLLDYQPSQATDIAYTHYTYRFPNQNIGFLLSGNYIVRVTEQGMEDEPLFERAFFVTEQATGVDFSLENVLTGNSSYPAVQPTVRFTPPPSAPSNAFDYTVCFVRNGRFDVARCSDRPILAGQPALQFYLQPDAAFEAEVADYFVDLGSLRVGGRIERTDLTSRPYKAFIEPDYARFAGTGLDPLLNGQIVVDAAVRDVPEPSIQAEYVETHFAYVPLNEQPMRGDVKLSGSFNGWAVGHAPRLTWTPERRRYEGHVLLKQGQYEYRYVVSDRRVVRAQSGAAPRLENLYTVLVYVSDLTFHTDRLLAVNSVLVR